MKNLRPSPLALTASALLACLALVACDKPAEQPPKPAAPTATPDPAPKPADHDHGHSDDHDHSHGDDHHHGATTQLGEQAVGGFTIKASRDGDIVAGKDAPIDVWVTPAGDTKSKPSVVRFWIGTESGRGSVKAKAEIEGDHWHTHAEIPAPLPEGSKLWVEIETDKGEKTVVGFDLKK